MTCSSALLRSRRVGGVQTAGSQYCKAGDGTGENIAARYSTSNSPSPVIPTDRLSSPTDRSNNAFSRGERDNSHLNSIQMDRKVMKGNDNDNHNHGHNHGHNHVRRSNSPNVVTGTSSSPYIQSQTQSHMSISCRAQAPTTPHQTYEYDKAIAALKDIKDLVCSHKPWLFGLESGTLKVNESYGPSCQPAEVLARSLVLPTYQSALSGIGAQHSGASKISSVPLVEKKEKEKEKETEKNTEIDECVEESGEFSVLGLNASEVQQVESELFALRNGLAEERELSGGECIVLLGCVRLLYDIVRVVCTVA